MSNTDAAGRAAKEFGAEVKIIKKTSPEYVQEKNAPPSPSVMLDGRLIAKNDTIAFDALKAAILSEEKTK